MHAAFPIPGDLPRSSTAASIDRIPFSDASPREPMAHFSISNWLESASDEEVRAVLGAIRDSDPEVVIRAVRGTGRDVSPDLIPLSEAELLEYPATVSAFVSRTATGEGTTTGFLVAQARDAEHLRDLVSREWGDWLVPGVYIREWQGMPREYGALIAPLLFEEFETTLKRVAFCYSAKLQYSWNK